MAGGEQRRERDEERTAKQQRANALAARADTRRSGLGLLRKRAPEKSQIDRWDLGERDHLG